MTSSALAQHFLQRLYQLAEKGGYSDYHSLDALAAEVGIDDSMKVLRVGEVLHERGLVKAVFSSSGSSACITGDGALAIEEAQEASIDERVPQEVPRYEGTVGLENLLHETVREHAYSQWSRGDWRDAVLNAFVAVFDLIRSRTTLDLDGDKLATRVFSVKKPVLQVADISTQSGENEQAGFMQLLQGAYRGIRNPKAHTLFHDLNREKAAQYLVFASLLARRVDEAESADSGEA